MPLKKKEEYCCYLNELAERIKQSTLDSTDKKTATKGRPKRGKNKPKPKGKPKKSKGAKKQAKWTPTQRDIEKTRMKFIRFFKDKPPRSIPKGVTLEDYKSIKHSTYKLFNVQHTYQCYLTYG